MCNAENEDKHNINAIDIFNDMELVTCEFCARKSSCNNKWNGQL